MDDRATPAAAAGPALAQALSIVGDRWTLLVVEALLEGPLRFGELQARVTGIAPNVLAGRLRHLERHGIVLAHPYSERPPRVVYELTQSGMELAAPLRLLTGWGTRHVDPGGAPRHADCGTPLEVRWWCPHCRRPLAEDEEPGAEELHFA